MLSSQKLGPGSAAPYFEGVDGSGLQIRLSDYLGSKVVLFFYPADFTLFCTREVCNLRDNYRLLLEAGYRIIGISTDSMESHKAFAIKYDLPFPLISDPNKLIAKDYGAWGRNGIMRLFNRGVKRMTFIIGEDGKILSIINNVRPRKHAGQILGEPEQSGRGEHLWTGQKVMLV